jgi:hypothetical protein
MKGASTITPTPQRPFLGSPIGPVGNQVLTRSVGKERVAKPSRLRPLEWLSRS